MNRSAPNLAEGWITGQGRSHQSSEQVQIFHCEFELFFLWSLVCVVQNRPWRRPVLYWAILLAFLNVIFRFVHIEKDDCYRVFKLDDVSSFWCLSVYCCPLCHMVRICWHTIDFYRFLFAGNSCLLWPKMTPLEAQEWTKVVKLCGSKPKQWAERRCKVL